MAGLSITGLEDYINGTLTVRRSYFDPGGVNGLIARVVEDHTAGRFPLVSTKVPGTWQAVANGQYDGWLSGLLTGVANTTQPVMLCLHHEPEDNVGPSGMTASSWVAMQNHAIAMAANLAPNTTITPILMQWTFDPRSGRNPADWLVPNAHVFGIDVYNDWAPGNGLAWRSFGSKLSMATAYANGKPVVVAEYGCHTDKSRPGRAAAWMKNAFHYAHKHNVVAMSYYDSSLHSKFGSWILDRERKHAMKICRQRPAVADF